MTESGTVHTVKLIPWEDSMRSGFCLKIENTALLTEVQCDTLREKLLVLAVSTTRLLDDPIMVVGHLMSVHYAYEYHAEETRQHVCRYLRLIGLESMIHVALHPAQWERKHEWGFSHDRFPREEHDVDRG
jgi:hypothetical protein